MEKERKKESENKYMVQYKLDHINLDGSLKKYHAMLQFFPQEETSASSTPEKERPFFKRVEGRELDLKHGQSIIAGY